MEVIKEYPLGQLFGKPNENIDFALLTSDELLKLITDEKNVDVHQYHKHDFYVIFWMEDGEVVQKLDDREYKLKRGDIFVSSPGQVHENDIKNIGPGIKGGAILFVAEYLNQLRQNYDISELTFLDEVSSGFHFHFSEMEFDVFLSILNALFKEIKKETPSRAVIKSLLSAALLSIQQAVDSSMMQMSSSRHIEVYKKFKSILEHNYKQNKALKFYADALYISERHLNRLLKETTSMTAAELIRGRTALEAKRLLCFTDLNITEIAWHLGYDDNSYFTKIFKKETGLTPLAYRASLS